MEGGKGQGHALSRKTEFLEVQECHKMTARGHVMINRIFKAPEQSFFLRKGEFCSREWWRRCLPEIVSGERVST
jgi:hypothetical protein